MNKKQKIIVSVVGIAIVLLALLGLLGLTYAYFLTRLQGNTNEKSISVTTADLKLEYSDNSDVILLEAEDLPVVMEKITIILLDYLELLVLTVL